MPQARPRVKPAHVQALPRLDQNQRNTGPYPMFLSAIEWALDSPGETTLVSNTQVFSANHIAGDILKMTKNHKNAIFAFVVGVRIC